MKPALCRMGEEHREGWLFRVPVNNVRKPVWLAQVWDWGELGSKIREVRVGGQDYECQGEEVQWPPSPSGPAVSEMSVAMCQA